MRKPKVTKYMSDAEFELRIRELLDGARKLQEQRKSGARYVSVWRRAYVIKRTHVKGQFVLRLKGGPK